jgi:hypothetical protein
MTEDKTHRERYLLVYRKAKEGEAIETPYGKAKIVRVIPYEEIIEEMRSGGVPENEIEGFNMRVSHFLGDVRKYFECEIRYKDGEVERIDWSEYAVMKAKKWGKGKKR